MDVLKLPMSHEGNQYLLVIQDYLTKFLWVMLMQDEKSETVVKITFFSLFFCILGIPQTILSGRGLCFISNVMQEVSRICKVKEI